MQLREQKGPGMNTKRRFAMSVLGLGVLVALLVGSFQLVSSRLTLPGTWQIQECAVRLVHLNGTAPATVTCAQNRLVTFKQQQDSAYVRQSSRLLTQFGPQTSGSPSCYTGWPGYATAVYQDAGYGGNCMGVTGVGVLNFTDYTMDYQIACFPYPYQCYEVPRSWNDQISSYQTGGNDGHFCWDINAGGCNWGFVSNENNSWIGSTWNDQISSVRISSSRCGC
jgi:hypothetical protein